MNIIWSDVKWVYHGIPTLVQSFRTYRHMFNFQQFETCFSTFLSFGGSFSPWIRDIHSPTSSTLEWDTWFFLPQTRLEVIGGDWRWFDIGPWNQRLGHPKSCLFCYVVRPWNGYDPPIFWSEGSDLCRMASSRDDHRVTTSSHGHRLFTMDVFIIM